MIELNPLLYLYNPPPRSEFDFEDLNVPRDLKKRGLLDDKSLHGYYYRDDALALWYVLQKFVRISLTLHYWTDADIKVSI